jgi:hypothetical protein
MTKGKGKIEARRGELTVNERGYGVWHTRRWALGAPTEHVLSSSRKAGFTNLDVGGREK